MLHTRTEDDHHGMNEGDKTTSKMMMTTMATMATMTTMTTMTTMKTIKTIKAMMKASE
jgi:hypothetical protein